MTNLPGIHNACHYQAVEADVPSGEFSRLMRMLATVVGGVSFTGTANAMCIPLKQAGVIGVGEGVTLPGTDFEAEWGMIPISRLSGWLSYEPCDGLRLECAYAPHSGTWHIRAVFTTFGDAYRMFMWYAGYQSCGGVAATTPQSPLKVRTRHALAPVA
jgi:hypothetical protein